MTIYDKMEEFQQLEKDINKQFADAKKGNQAEADALEIEIAGMVEENKELYTLYAMRQITQKSYEDHSQEVREKKASLNSIENVIVDINRLRDKEIEKEVFYPLNDLRKVFDSTNHKGLAELRSELLNNKAVYLQSIIDSKKEFNKIRGYKTFAERLQVQLGLQKDMYGHLTDDINPLIRNMYSGRQGIDINEQEIRSVYTSGKLPSDLISELK